MGFIRKILFIGMLICLWSGGWGLWNGLFHGKPTEVVLSDAKPDTPDHVTFKNVQLGVTDAVISERYKKADAVYFPIRPRGAAKTVPVYFLLKVTEPELLAQFGKTEDTAGKEDFARLAAVMTLLAKYTAKTEMTGMIASGLDTSSKLERDLKKMVPTLHQDFKVFVEGEKPSWLRGLGLLAGAFVCLVLLGKLTPAEPDTTAGVPPVQTASSARPPQS